MLKGFREAAEQDEVIEDFITMGPPVVEDEDDD